MAANLPAALIGRLKARRSEIALALADGGAQTFDVYHRLVGTYQGLGEALDVLDALLRQDEEQD